MSQAWKNKNLSGRRGGEVSRLSYDALDGWDFTCECPDNFWCEHIEERVRNHKDAGVFWGTIEKYPDRNWWPMQVPIIPTERVIAWTKIARANSKEPWAIFLVYESPFDTSKQGAVIGG